MKKIFLSLVALLSFVMFADNFIENYNEITGLRVITHKYINETDNQYIHYGYDCTVMLAPQIVNGDLVIYVSTFIQNELYIKKFVFIADGDRVEFRLDDRVSDYNHKVDGYFETAYFVPTKLGCKEILKFLKSEHCYIAVIGESEYTSKYELSTEFKSAFIETIEKFIKYNY